MAKIAKVKISSNHLKMPYLDWTELCDAECVEDNFRALWGRSKDCTRTDVLEGVGSRGCWAEDTDSFLAEYTTSEAKKEIVAFICMNTGHK